MQNPFARAAHRLPALLIATVLAAAWASPAAAQVGYGRASAVGDNEAFVGEPGNLIEPGAVYVYTPGSGGWDERQRLTASDGVENDGFGRSIATGDNLLVVGANVAGSAYVFTKVDGKWHESARLDPGVAGRTGFGRAVAVADNTAVIGAPDLNGGRGAVFVFRREGETWRRLATLEGDGSEQSETTDGDITERPEGFGTNVAIDGDWALVGAPGGAVDLFLGTMFSSGPASGSAYLFHRDSNTGTWERTDKLNAPGDAKGTLFGSAVAVQGDEAMIGAEAAQQFRGAVFTYHRADDGWDASATLGAFDARPRSNFGAALAMFGDELLVGAPGAGVNRLEGRVYRFVRGSSGEWAGSTKLGSAGLKWGSTYGASVALRGDIAVAGLSGDDYGAGSAVILTRVDSGWDRSRVLSEARGLPSITGTGLPCTQGKAGIFPCDNVELVSFLPISEIGGGRGVTINDLWGWTDPETDREYVVAGLRDSTTFVDVTDESHPIFVGKLPKAQESPASLWRDVKVYNNTALIAADASGPHGVQFFDLTQLRAYDGTPIVFEESNRYRGTHSTHNLNVNAESSFAYAVGNSAGGETCGGALHMINIEDPRDPIFAGCFEPVVAAGQRPAGTHDVQCVNYAGPDTRYAGQELCFSSDSRAFSISNVTDKRNPSLVASSSYPNLAYTHQGWLDEDHRYFYMNDEGDEAAGLVEGTRTLIWDVQDLEDPILVSEYTTDNPATDHNLYIVGDVMYQSNYRSGLRVVDITDRENPTALGYFDTVPWGTEEGMGDIVSGGIGSWSNYPFFKSGIIAVSSSKEGLFILRLGNSDDRP